MRHEQSPKSHTGVCGYEALRVRPHGNGPEGPQNVSRGHLLAFPCVANCRQQRFGVVTLIYGSGRLLAPAPYKGGRSRGVVRPRVHRVERGVGAESRSRSAISRFSDGIDVLGFTRSLLSGSGAGDVSQVHQAALASARAVFEMPARSPHEENPSGSSGNEARVSRAVCSDGFSSRRCCMVQEALPCPGAVTVADCQAAAFEGSAETWSRSSSGAGFTTPLSLRHSMVMAPSRPSIQ